MKKHPVALESILICSDPTLHYAIEIKYVCIVETRACHRASFNPLILTYSILELSDYNIHLVQELMASPLETIPLINQGLVMGMMEVYQTSPDRANLVRVFTLLNQ